MSGNESTIVYKSNVFPVYKSELKEDREFLKRIHDPFALERMQNEGYVLTSMQKKEYGMASVHCTYAYDDDFPWGTITTENGQKVVCKCTKADCCRFKECRPDFDDSELRVYEENKTVREKLFPVVPSLNDTYKADSKDYAAFRKAIENEATDLGDDNLEPIYDSGLPEMKFTDNPSVQFMEADAYEAVQPPKEIGFASFVASTQEEIITWNPSARIVINAGPGTGKTWTLIEKIIYMVNEREAAAEDILVLCFSRPAVEVIKGRLSAAAEMGRIGYEWRNIDIRTFDSFATYMLAWVQKELPDLLPKGFNLDYCDYEQRIEQAVLILSQKEDMLADYRQIIIDEVQDLVGSRAQLVLALLKGLPDTCGFTLLGDSCQSLYDYLAEDNPAVMSSEEFYREIFKNFATAFFCSFTENHRQGDKLGAITIPYRTSILTGTSEERCSAATALLSEVALSDINLPTISKEEADVYIKNGTLGILTRTNGQALQISAWLRVAKIPHTLSRGSGMNELGDWISKIFADWENETTDENSFIQRHIKIFPELGYDKAENRWLALVNTLNDETRKRLEISDILHGLLRNARQSELYESNDLRDDTIVVSNIHKAKGQEFDSVIVVNDVISAMADESQDKQDTLEHKVCYVALTRAKKVIERALLPEQQCKYIYVTPNESRRCSKASLSRKKKKPYISHFEVGGDNDIDKVSFAEDIERQRVIRNELVPGMRLKLKKCPLDERGFVSYCIVEEDREHVILGYTGKEFADELGSAMQRILKISSHSHVEYEVFPHAFCDVYVGNIISCISSSHAPLGARTYGDISVWTGFTITGFAAVDKDTY